MPNFTSRAYKKEKARGVMISFLWSVKKSPWLKICEFKDFWYEQFWLSAFHILHHTVLENPENLLKCSIWIFSSKWHFSACFTIFSNVWIFASKMDEIAQVLARKLKQFCAACFARNFLSYFSVMKIIFTFRVFRIFLKFCDFNPVMIGNLMLLLVLFLILLFLQTHFSHWWLCYWLQTSHRR